MARLPARARLGILFAIALLPTVASTPAAASISAVSHAPAAATADEKFYLSLVNCTRTGGWVNENGSCSDRGSGKHSNYVKPLRLDIDVTVKVARPMAHRIADAGKLDHYLGGSPSSRMNRAGFSSPVGESLGASSTGSRAGLIRVHRMMQAEKSYNGWHWRNMKNASFKSMGIGIVYQSHVYAGQRWVANAWLANDFWHGG